MEEQLIELVKGKTVIQDTNITKIVDASRIFSEQQYTYCHQETPIFTYVIIEKHTYVILFNKEPAAILYNGFLLVIPRLATEFRQALMDEVCKEIPILNPTQLNLILKNVQ